MAYRILQILLYHLYKKYDFYAYAPSIKTALLFPIGILIALTLSPNTCENAMFTSTLGRLKTYFQFLKKPLRRKHRRGPDLGAALSALYLLSADSVRKPCATVYTSSLAIYAFSFAGVTAARIGREGVKMALVCDVRFTADL